MRRRNRPTVRTLRKHAKQNALVRSVPGRRTPRNGPPLFRLRESAPKEERINTMNTPLPSPVRPCAKVRMQNVFADRILGGRLGGGLRIYPAAGRVAVLFRIPLAAELSARPIRCFLPLRCAQNPAAAVRDDLPDLAPAHLLHAGADPRPAGREARRGRQRAGGDAGNRHAVLLVLGRAALHRLSSNPASRWG